jgi:hypothetical protein
VAANLSSIRGRFSDSYRPISRVRCPSQLSTGLLYTLVFNCAWRRPRLSRPTTCLMEPRFGYCVRTLTAMGRGVENTIVHTRCKLSKSSFRGVMYFWNSFLRLRERLEYATVPSNSDTRCPPSVAVGGWDPRRLRIHA